MIKSIGLLRRKDGLTHEQFIKHWVEVHAPMARKLKRVRRYVLNLVVTEPTRADVPLMLPLGGIDGIAEVWYDDMESYEAHKASPEGKEWLADAATFIGSVNTYLVDERVIVS